MACISKYNPKYTFRTVIMKESSLYSTKISLESMKHPQNTRPITNNNITYNALYFSF